MLILLPPSETKTTPPAGLPLDWAGLSSPELTADRRAMLAELARVSRAADAAATLRVSPNLQAQIDANLRIESAPAAPAAQIYTGVLFAAADLAHAPAVGGGPRVLIFSGLWGIVGPADRIPPYRLAANVALPGLGAVARWWRPRLAESLDRAAAGELVVDCRSAGYAAMWQATAGTIAIRVLRVNGAKRTVVSHHAKHLRGVLTGALARTAGDELPADADHLAQFALAAGKRIGVLPTGERVRDVELTTKSAGRVLTFVIAE